ncbi:MAG: hypothetical protein HY508_15295 [Acidobacteria bacterium]|nr:hypothetical protein [Acidobacteriota bacterium]
MVALGSTWVWGQKQPAAQKTDSVAWKAPSRGDASQYAGIEICSTCHEDEARQFGKTVHAKAGVEGTTGAGCESCHGPGKAHADAQMEAGSDTAKIDAAKKLIFSFHSKTEENAARCLDCHSTSRDQDLFNRSEHKLNGVACNECHAPHLLFGAEGREVKEPMIAQGKFFSAPRLKEENRWLSESLLRNKQPELCFGCHRTIQAQFALPTHHRVPEGLMKCTDCHNAHGTFQRPLLKKSNWEACVACHTEKRGPFVFEHAPVKVEGCVICHTPHGSVTRNLLTRREDRFSCLECHVDPFAANVPHGRLGFQTRGECVRCHATIHGSNVSEYFIQ